MTAERTRRTVLRLAALAGVPSGIVSSVTAVEAGRRNGGSPDREVVVSVDSAAESMTDTIDRATPAEATVLDESEGLGMTLVAMPDGADVDAGIDSIEANEGVAYATRNRKFTTDHLDVPDERREQTADVDPSSFDPDDPNFSRQIAPTTVDADDAWVATTGDADVTIAVLDQGVKYDHEDLAANMDDSVTNYGTDEVDGDGNPYPEVFGSGDNPVEAHGTQVAGIAGAVTDNGTGVAGISDCSLLSVRVLDTDGQGDGWDIVNGIEWAADNGADVINLSLGATGEWDPYDDAVDYAHNRGAITIASAGNTAERETAYGPGSQTTMAVSATEYDDSFTSFSSWGPYVNVAAPGLAATNGETTYPAANGEPSDEYSFFSGTSMAAPVVSGVAALVLSVAPDDWDPDDLRQHIEATADDIGLEEEKQGAGRVNAADAVFDLLDPSFAPSVNDDESVLSVLESRQAIVDGTVTNDGNDPGRQTVALHVGDEQVDADEDVVIDAGATYEYRFTFYPDAADDGATVEVRTDDDTTTRELSVDPLGDEIAFAEQATAGDTLRVTTATMERSFAVVLTVDGDWVGSSGPHEAGTTLDGRSVMLSQPLEEDATVTATLHFADGETIGDPVTRDGESVSATADVTVTQAVEYAGEDGVVDTPDLQTAVGDWRSGALDEGGLVDVIDAWANGTTFN